MFYAKSLKRAVGAEKSSAVAEVYLRLLNAAEGYLDSKERVVIENSLRKARQGGEKPVSYTHLIPVFSINSLCLISRSISNFQSFL